ncbi:RagB/SusD family nutrient uptake outer membrane protein [Flavivirga jejuensis]|uniref:RagB/SusD family nutrient uptake outer membrane protein n=1 Tax=Flavivirga jejuensis TaxID=870487 RepID=A0ABT8WKC4_9FLAO|nr:RagB/SusD family nutrient uptake outer membrane protein [Flavivirga jejuensis]MDO5973510.1 RagB/SusD family nutrient uptake outer membrane protein [Flavivirga jejuensis]
MKKIALILVLSLVITSCNDDFLERFPLSELSPENSFNTAEDLELFTNSFYNDLPNFGDVIESDNLSDNVLFNGMPNEQTGMRLVPSEAGSGGWDWDDLRKINIFFENFERCPDEAARIEYSGVAHFFRALFYYNKLKRFGDVPWYDQVIGSTDTDLLFKPRDSRVFVVDKILKDIDKAIENLNVDQSSDRVNRWIALGLKSRICLFEGTFRKYHTNLKLPGADGLLNLAAEAAKRVMDESPYVIYTAGNTSTDYRDLFASDAAIEDEVMLARRYSLDLNVINNINYYFTSPTQEDIGLTKSIVDTYLMVDGTPFTSQAGYEFFDLVQESKNRDPRLAQTIRTPGYTRIGNSTEALLDFSASISGYQIAKYVADESQDGFQAGFQDIPILRYAEVLLNFAEAKAELGTLTQTDLDASVSLLRNRVGMPALNLNNANSNPDPILANTYPNVVGSNQGVILEIRRERRVELVLEGFRYDDLMRWRNGILLEAHFKGMYFSGLGAFDINGDSIEDVEIFLSATSTGAPQSVEIGGIISLSNGTSGNLVPFPDRVKAFDESRDYLYPIPFGDIQLNPKLKQNPNW